MSRHHHRATDEAHTQNVPSIETMRPTEEQIRNRAYEKFCNRNGAGGDAVNDWLQAERELIEQRTAVISKH